MNRLLDRKAVDVLAPVLFVSPDEIALVLRVGLTGGTGISLRRSVQRTYWFSFAFLAMIPRTRLMAFM